MSETSAPAPSALARRDEIRVAHEDITVRVGPDLVFNKMTWAACATAPRLFEDTLVIIDAPKGEFQLNFRWRGRRVGGIVVPEEASGNAQVELANQWADRLQRLLGKEYEVILHEEVDLGLMVKWQPGFAARAAEAV